MTFLSSKKTHFEKTTSSDENPKSLLQKKEAWKTFGIFNQNHGLTPLEKCKFLDYSKRKVLACIVMILWNVLLLKKYLMEPFSHFGSKSKRLYEA